MKIQRFLLVLLIVLSMPASGFTVNQYELKNKMMLDLDVIRQAFGVMYAPAEWKKTYAGWDLEEQINQAKARVSAADCMSVKEYQHILRDFFKSTRDYHVDVLFHSTEFAFLPFRVEGANGKYFVRWFSPELLECFSFTSTSAWMIGDEIVLIDGRPTHEVVTELKLRELGNPESATDQALAEIMLTMRDAAYGQVVPSGCIDITVKHAKGQLATYNLMWMYSPEEITAGLQPHNLLIPLQHDSPFHKKMSIPFNEHRKKQAKKRCTLTDNPSGGDLDPIGSPQSFIPKLGKVIWENTSWNSFDAYLFELPNKKTVGFLRIPHYDNTETEEFEKLIAYFQKKSDALIIDQLNNSGGYILYMYALASMLTNYPLTPPTQRMMITQRDAASALEEMNTLQTVLSDEDAEMLYNSDEFLGYPVSQHLIDSLHNHFTFILDEWKNGKTLTDPNYFYGLDTIHPHPRTRYTKPILLLINSLDFSSADFLPAMLQDSKRATLMGTRTAGAGGYVLSHNFPNRFGVDGFQFTGSFGQRLDKQPIENLGVTPDIWYSFTEEDLGGNYAGYKAKILQVVQGMIKN